ncbi:hypothetical protein Q5762_30835 [Streptomyces sp. P9(2023)]|uniref:hypothetical protein n=1 Tax=Streptomyces sp. P9(2023) TaxID=3064394 RepID=UPI0028F43B50|nr:hypothetical protein [Streptomyces sp. P9(2023)]MDT9692650.1 hypothetical protein [Streptomyces sp. P9(2023)]
MGGPSSAVRRLLQELFSRVGFGTLLITIGGAVALGMVPNITEVVAGQRVIVFGGIFVLAVLVVFVGWWMRRDRGVGVVVWLMPGTGSPQRLREVIGHAQARHGAWFAVRRDRLWPDEQRVPALSDRVEVAYWQVQDRLEGHEPGTASAAHVSLYVHARLPETFGLGRRLANDALGQLDVMHFSHRTGDPVAKVMELDSRLARAADDADRAAVRQWLTAESLQAVPEPFDDVAADHRHRLMLIVSLTPNPNVVAAATQVARTGEVMGPDGHTGYYFDANDPSAPGRPCGARMVVETKGGHLRDEPGVYEPLVRHIIDRWRVGCRIRQQQIGGRPVEGLLVLSAPGPIALALGKFIGQQLTLVAHSMELARGEEPML